MRKLLLFLSVTLFIIYAYGESWRRVMGGKSAEKGQFPFFVQLKITKSQSLGLNRLADCGATLLHPKWILSAAHCFTLNKTTTVQVPPDMFKRNLVQAMMGSEKKAKDLNDPNFVVRNLEKVIFHAKFTWEGANDIAVAPLKQPFTLNEYIKTVVLPGEKERVCEKAIVVGTGQINTGGTSPSTVRYTDVTVFKVPQSPNIYSHAELLHKHPYLGDSGGPLLCSSIQHATILGYFPVPSNRQVTSIYLLINPYIGFIKEHVPLRTFYAKRTGRTKKKYNKDSINSQKASNSNGRKASIILFFVTVYIIV